MSKHVLNVSPVTASNLGGITSEVVSQATVIASNLSVGQERSIPSVSYLTVKLGKKNATFQCRRDVSTKRFNQLIGELDTPINDLNNSYQKFLIDSSVISGALDRQMSVIDFFTFYFAPYVENNHRDADNLLNRFKVLLDVMGDLANKPIANITKLDAVKTLNKIKGRDIKPSTLNRYRYALQSLFRLAVEYEVIDRNVVSTIKKETENNIQVRVVRGAELTHFVNFCGARSNRIAALALLFLLFSGMRSMEALTMRFSMISPCGTYVDLPTTKSGMGRRVQLNKAAQGVLIECKSLSVNQWVFPSMRTENHITYPRAVLNKVLADMAAIGVLNGHLTLHCLRRSFGSQLLERTSNLRAVQVAMGLSDSRVTERYTHISDTSMSRNVSTLDADYQFSPRRAVS